MRPIFSSLACGGLALAVVFSNSPSARGDLLLHYQFETVEGDAPTQTTPDSTGNFVSSNVAPLVNALVGYDTLTPGVDYPKLTAGPVANTTVQSLNPSNAMQFYGGVAANYTRVEIADAAAGALDTTFTNFSVALWLNPNDDGTDPVGPDNARFAIGKMGTGSNRGWQLARPNGTSDLSFDYFPTNLNTDSRTLKLTGALPAHTWTHIAFTFDGAAGAEKFYVNGVATTPLDVSNLLTVPATFNSANDQPLRVGNRGRASSTSTTIFGWLGGIDDVRIYNETLTAAQVQALLASVSSQAGDFDADGDVDGADFVAWQTNFPTATGATQAQGDADNDQDVDGADFAAWQQAFPSGSGVTAIPEPHSVVLLVIGGMAWVAATSRRA